MAPLDDLFLDFQTALAGRYSIDRELGRGGMGIVYLAREVHLDRPVAIKLLPPEQAADPALRERFLREARLAAKLSHPNIIPIHAVEEAGDYVYYAMSYVDGESLAHRVRTRGPLPASEGVRVLRDVAWALANAHEQGVVHRDVKPDNILIEAASNRVLVADFGIAAAHGDAAGDAVSGTPEFMSPEQAMGSEVDARSDLYSLGATAYFAFTGRLLFEGRTPTEVIAKQVTEDAPSLVAAGTPVPRKVAALIDRCLAKDPAERPAGAALLAEQMSVAIELRRELPVALRTFVKDGGRLNGGGTIVGSLGVLVSAVGVAMFFGGRAGLFTIAVGATLLPFAAFTAAARQLVKRGFAQMDLAPAFKAEVDQTREEHAVTVAKGESKLEWTLKMATAVSGITSFAVVVADSMLNARSLSNDAILFINISLAIAMPTFLVSAGGYLAILERRREVDTTFWSRVWNGPVGRAAFAVARRLVGRDVVDSAITHRATELSLAMAAEQLYAKLPRASREQLRDVPTMLHALQDDAQALRHHLDQLNDVLTDAGDAATTPAYSEVRRDRDAIQAKLGETVGALEAIRLNLLQLHAGALSPGGLTTTIAQAGDVSREVQRLLEGQEEVRRLLHDS